MPFDQKKSPTLPEKLQWKNADEPALMEWTLKVRNYNTGPMDGLFALGVFLLIAPVNPFTDAGLAIRDNILASIIMIVAGSSAFYWMTHQKVYFACRLTASGMEYCEWKFFPT